MLEDIKAKALKALRINLQQIKIFRENKRLRDLHSHWMALRQAISG